MAGWILFTGLFSFIIGGFCGYFVGIYFIAKYIERTISETKEEG